MILKCIAVDDEPLALKLMESYINQTPSLELKGLFLNAVEALKAIHEMTVDIIFLDIRMNDISGLELAKLINQRSGSTLPRIIFTTAYDQYALESYKVDALDYLLKPFDYVDFSAAVNKAIRYFERIDNTPQKVELPQISEDKVDYIYLKVEYKLVRIPLDDILYIESDKDYVKVYIQNEPNPILSLSSLKSVEEKLPNKNFMRIHRSFIVGLNKVKAATKTSVEVSGRLIPVTEQYRDAYSIFFNNWQ